MVSNNSKRNLHHFNMKKVEHVQLFHIKMKEEHVQLFHIKMKEDQIIIFCKIHGHFNMIFKNDHFEMIVYFSL